MNLWQQSAIPHCDHTQHTYSPLCHFFINSGVYFGQRYSNLCLFQQFGRLCILWSKALTVPTPRNENMYCVLKPISDNNKDIDKSTYPYNLHCLVNTFFFKNHMSRVMRKSTFCICENKDADQLRGVFAT